MTSQSAVTFRPPLRDVRGRFAVASDNLIKNQRESVRKLGARWVKIAREEAPRKSGDFAASIQFRSFQKGKQIGFTTSSAQPLGKFIVFGTKPHRIYPRRASALYFFWTKVGMFTVVPKGGGMTGVSGGKFWIGKGYVNHPGTKPNPYVDRAYDRWEKDVDLEIARISRDFVIDITGKPA